MSDKKYRDLDDFEEIEGDYAEIDEQFDEVEYDEIDEQFDEVDYDEIDEQFDELVDEEFEPDEIAESVLTKQRSSKRQRVIGLLQQGVAGYNRATDVILNMGKKRRRNMKNSIHPSQVTGIKGDTTGIMHISGKNIGITTPTPNVSLTAIPPKQTKIPLKKTNTRQLTPPIRANSNSLNGVLVKPNKQGGRIINTGVTKKSILHTPVKKSYLSNINPDLNNYLTKPMCVRKSTAERSTIVNLSGFDCLTDKILKQKRRGKK